MANINELEAAKTFVKSDGLVLDGKSPSGKAYFFLVKGDDSGKGIPVPVSQTKVAPNGELLIRADIFRRKFPKLDAQARLPVEDENA